SHRAAESSVRPGHRVIPSAVVSDPVHRGASSPAADRPTPGVPAHAGRTGTLIGHTRLLVGRLVEAGRRLTPEWRDAVLYGCAALFALSTGLAMGIPLYRQWGQLATGPYALAAVGMAMVAFRWSRHRSGARRARQAARVAAFLVVLFGATVVPLALEVNWRSQGDAA